MERHLSAIIGKAPINEEKLGNTSSPLLTKEDMQLLFKLVLTGLLIGELNMDVQENHENLPDSDELIFFFAKELRCQTHAIIQTDYFEGIGDQYAMLFGDKDPLTGLTRINDVLQNVAGR